METRQQRGLELASLVYIRRKGKAWVVPSQTGGKLYTVDLENGHCSCPGHGVRKVKCKHLYAVEYTAKKRATYAQDWPAYNAAQSEEKTRFMLLLSDLCRGVPQPEQTNGRPRLPLADMLFAVVLKVYCGFSSRRFTCDLKEAHKSGFVYKPPHFNSVNRCLANPEITEVLKRLVTLSSLPLKAVETGFAVDSSGFSTCRFVRWFNKKHGRETYNKTWVKCHLMCGTKRQIVTAVDISVGRRTIRTSLSRWSKPPQSTSSSKRCRQTKPTYPTRTYAP